MYIAQVIDSGGGPSGISAMFATPAAVQVMENINQAGRVIFSSLGDPVREQFRKFKNTVGACIEDQADRIRNTYAYITSNDVIQPIVVEEDLSLVGPTMRMAILTHQPIRDLHQQGRIYGYDIDPAWVPKEDVYGRLINNGTVEQFVNDKGKLETPEYMEWTWDSSDPHLSIEELEHIEETRGFIDKFLDQQLGIDGDRIDPTDYAAGGIIGKEK